VDDVDEQVKARRKLDALARSDNERMTHFNARFNTQVQYVRSCGIPTMLPRDQLPQYLRTLRSCEARDIYYQVRRYTERIASGKSFTLTDVQGGLQQCNNKARSQSTSTGRHRQSTRHDPHHSSSEANASSESPVVYSRRVECWSCEENHPLSACPTTLVAD
jgi:hypothetical protein